MNKIGRVTNSLYCRLRYGLHRRDSLPCLVFFLTWTLCATAEALTAPFTVPVVGHKPALSPSYQGRLLVGDTIHFLPGYHDLDGDAPSPQMRYEFYVSTADGHMLAPLQDGQSTSLLLPPLLNGQHLAVKTRALSLTGDPMEGEPLTYVFLHKVGHLLGVTAVGEGLRVGSEGTKCILDGIWTTGYSPTCVVYSLDAPNFGWAPNKTFFEVSYDAAFAARKFVFHGYWRQSKAGSLGNWAVYGCADIACSSPKKITTTHMLSFVSAGNVEGGTIRVLDVKPYYRYRFVFEGGSVDANGGKGSGSFNEIEIE